ncbi:DUF397 domain-containing protein [Streptomyces sp. AM 4-1-1]|uniref:DUF397 domain-containing protein n=1 Tax=Streptomyces sp. AM 4-1-1 TaxID=3028710 RepID=UPI0023B8FD43|nr:DUF397 domain-containing protein [Streptomyces sp. AM 4-1-1]WEH35571.1 DUF397 domain-containing protein [Streptomyces sp. AM 4-1-1]
MTRDTSSVFTAPRQWTRSSYSGQQGNCVEWRQSPDGGHVHVRDSKDSDSPILRVGPDAWGAAVGFARTRGAREFKL